MEPKYTTVILTPEQLAQEMAQGGNAPPPQVNFTQHSQGSQANSSSTNAGPNASYEPVFPESRVIDHEAIKSNQHTQPSNTTDTKYYGTGWVATTANTQTEEEELGIKNNFNPWNAASNNQAATSGTTNMPRTSTEATPETRSSSPKRPPRQASAPVVEDVVAKQRTHIHIGMPTWVPFVTMGNPFKPLGTIFKLPFWFLEPKNSEPQHERLEKPASIITIIQGVAMVAIGLGFTYDGLGVFMRDKMIVVNLSWMFNLTLNINMRFFFAMVIMSCVLIALIGDHRNKLMRNYAITCFTLDVITNFFGMMDLMKPEFSLDWQRIGHLIKTDAIWLVGVILFGTFSVHLTLGGFEFISFALHAKSSQANKYNASANKRR
jgi:hypothetical protein